jgi:hypothetical protein
MITVGLMMVVLGVIYSALDEVVRVETYTSDRTESLDEMRVALNRMTRELRQASMVDEVTSIPSRIEFDSYGPTGPRHVVYTASGTVLTRQVGTGAPITVLAGLASTSVFTYLPVPGTQWVRIKFQVRPKHTPETVLILDSEVNLRNRTGALS